MTNQQPVGGQRLPDDDPTLPDAIGLIAIPQVDGDNVYEPPGPRRSSSASRARASNKLRTFEGRSSRWMRLRLNYVKRALPLYVLKIIQLVMSRANNLPSLCTPHLGFIVYGSGLGIPSTTLIGPLREVRRMDANHEHPTRYLENQW